MAASSRLISSSSVCITSPAAVNSMPQSWIVQPAVALLGDEPVGPGSVAEAAVGRNPLELPERPGRLAVAHLVEPQVLGVLQERRRAALDRTAGRSTSAHSCSEPTRRPRSALPPSRSTRACRAWRCSGTPDRGQTSARRCPAVADTRRLLRRERTARRNARRPRSAVVELQRPAQSGRPSVRRREMLPASRFLLDERLPGGGFWTMDVSVPAHPPAASRHVGATVELSPQRNVLSSKGKGVPATSASARRKPTDRPARSRATPKCLARESLRCRSRRSPDRRVRCWCRWGCGR